MQFTKSNLSVFNSSARTFKKLWTGIVTILAYIKSFKWVVDIARWIQDTGAVIAESGFTLAILYVIIFKFGHLLLVWVPTDIITVCNQVCMIVFTILPELVMVSIIIATFDHWSMAKVTHEKKSYAWCVAYALLTILFITMTLFLLGGLANGFTTDATQAKGGVFVLRCFSGLFYTVLQKLWDKKGKGTYIAHYQKLQSDIAEQGVLLSKTSVSLSETSVSLVELQQKLVGLEQEKMSLSLALAGKKVTRKSDTPHTESTMVAATESHTPVNITDIRSKLKREITQIVSSGKKLNFTEISKSVGVHPNTVRKHAPSIITEIAQERPAVNS